MESSLSLSSSGEKRYSVIKTFTQKVEEVYLSRHDATQALQQMQSAARGLPARGLALPVKTASTDVSSTATKRNTTVRSVLSSLLVSQPRISLTSAPSPPFPSFSPFSQVLGLASVLDADRSFLRGGILKSGGLPLTAAEKTKVGVALAKDHSIDIRALGLALNVGDSTLYEWRKGIQAQLDRGIVQPGLKEWNAGGRYRLLHPTVKERFREDIRAAMLAYKSLERGNETLTMMITAVQESEALYGKSVTTTSLTWDQIQSIKDDLNVSEVKGRDPTVARLNELADPRNAIAASAMNEAYCRGRPPSHIGNFDKTTFEVEMSGKIAWRLKDADLRRVESKSQSSGNLPFGISWLPLVFADGNTGPSVYMIADNTLPSDVTIILPVTGLSVSSVPGEIAYVVVGSSRTGGGDFSEWYWKNVVIRAVDDIRRAGDDRAVFISCDGEAVMLNAATADKNPDLAALIDAAKIILGKLGASTSMWTQSLDASDVFKEAKRIFRSTTDAESENQMLLDRVKAALSSDSRIGLSAEMKRRIANGLVRLVYALRKACTTPNIMAGFERVGQLGVASSWDRLVRPLLFGAEKKGQTTTSYQWKGGEYQDVMSKWPLILAEFRREGRLTDKYMDGLGLPRAVHDDGAIHKESRVLWRQRATVINDSTFVAHLRELLAAKEAASVELAATKAKEDEAKAEVAKIIPIAAEASEALTVLTAPLARAEAAVADAKGFVEDAAKSKSAGFASCKEKLSEVVAAVKAAKDLQKECNESVKNMKKLKGASGDLEAATAVKDSIPAKVLVAIDWVAAAVKARDDAELESKKPSLNVTEVQQAKKQKEIEACKRRLERLLAEMGGGVAAPLAPAVAAAPKEPAAPKGGATKKSKVALNSEVPLAAAKLPSAKAGKRSAATAALIGQGTSPQKGSVPKTGETGETQRSRGGRPVGNRKGMEMYV